LFIEHGCSEDEGFTLKRISLRHRLFKGFHTHGNTYKSSVGKIGNPAEMEMPAGSYQPAFDNHLAG
jgi:hypothetical protein